MSNFEKRLNEAIKLVLEGHSVETVARAVESALDKAYHYGMSQPGSFGNAATIGGAKRMIALVSDGETDVEAIADAAHEGWADVAKTFDDPVYQTKPEKKLARLKLANTPYAQLSEEEKEKDRVAARVVLASWVSDPNNP